MSTHALASLTANYTDSELEGEEESPSRKDDENEKSKSPSDHPSVDSVEENEDSKDERPMLQLPKPSAEVVSRVATLVSYHDDTVVSDDERETDHKMDIADERPEEPPSDGVELPPEPTGRVSPRLIERVTKLHERMQQGLDMNELIQNRKDFRNPSIYEKLIQFCGINELGTNYSPKVYDPARWGKDSFYEELAKIQKTEMDKREKDKKDKGKVEVVSGTRKPGLLSSVLGTANEDDSKRRKSKWDQVGASGTASMVRSSGILQPTLTTAASGTKSTVISAFGTLSKKPKM